MNAALSPQVLYSALEATWPAAAQRRLGPFMLREGQGGGKRVSAAITIGPVALDDIDLAESAGTNLFMLREADGECDAMLAARGYEIVDPTLIYAAPASSIAAKPPPVSLFAHWPPLAVASSSWIAQGIGPARQAVMARAPDPKAAFLIRGNDRVAGVAFCALDGAVAMVHAVEILPQARRRGLGMMAMRGMADWALVQGAEVLALAVTRANAPARALYSDLGMGVATRYHYRMLPKSKG